VKIAVISDIHSNIQALREVARDISHAKVDMILCAGDIVGYCANPNECCETVQEMTKHIVLGNHDSATVKNKTGGMSDLAKAGIRHAVEVLTPANLRFLRSLPSELRFTTGGKKVAVFHGSPWSIKEYVGEPPVPIDILIDESCVRLADCDVLVLGHTHVPYVKKYHAAE